jgi:release factor glutamine methyltransferase
LISIYAAKQSAIVSSSDISENALRNISINLQLNNVTIQQFQSDLFDNIPKHIFDFIIINPPYYKGKPIAEKDFAWYAGEQLEYFQKLFVQLKDFTNAASKVYVILSDECDTQQIKLFAARENFVLKEVWRNKNILETNFIFKIVNATKQNIS